MNATMTKKAVVLNALADVRAGMTALEIASWTGLNRSTVRARLVDLSRSGDVIMDGTRPTRNGQLAPVYISSQELKRRIQAEAEQDRLNALLSSQPTPPIWIGGRIIRKFAAAWRRIFG